MRDDAVNDAGEEIYNIEYAIKLADFWEAGKMIGGDRDAVISALLKEVKRLREENNHERS